MKRRARRIALIFLGVIGILLAIPAVLTWRIVRQERLNQALIEAAKQSDDKAALRLLKQGADANCWEKSAASTSLLRLLLTWLHGGRSQKQTVTMTPLAYAACGGAYAPGPNSLVSENASLVEALLDYGADANASVVTPVYFIRESVLSLAVFYARPATVRILLAHGARWQDDGQDLLFIAAHEHQGYGGPGGVIYRLLKAAGAKR